MNEKSYVIYSPSHGYWCEGCKRTWTNKVVEATQYTKEKLEMENILDYIQLFANDAFIIDSELAEDVEV